MNIRSKLNLTAKLNPKAMRDAADECSALLKALSNRHRLLVLCHLVDGEKSVGQLASFLDIRDSTASQHLALLRRDRIIASRRDGQTIWYRIASEPVLAIMQVLSEAYCAGSNTQPARRRK
jgi:DNA-binding transcriptional ArsR family regulator